MKRSEFKGLDFDLLIELALLACATLLLTGDWPGDDLLVCGLLAMALLPDAGIDWRRRGLLINGCGTMRLGDCGSHEQERLISVPCASGDVATRCWASSMAVSLKSMIRSSLHSHAVDRLNKHLNTLGGVSYRRLSCRAMCGPLVLCCATVQTA